MKIFFRETVISLILSVILIFILSVMISKTSIKEEIILPAIIVISSISIMIGGIRVSKFKKQNGIINGVILGIIYMLSMYLISSIALKDFSLSSNSLIMIFLGIFTGIVGGIIGVNINK